MDKNTMKNIVVLKDLPSNIIEEALIVFKDNAKVHKLQKIEKTKITKDVKTKNIEDYALKEAEIVIKEYISKIERKEYEIVDGNIKIKQKYKRLKYLTSFLGGFAILSIIVMLLK